MGFKGSEVQILSPRPIKSKGYGNTETLFFYWILPPGYKMGYKKLAYRSRPLPYPHVLQTVIFLRRAMVLSTDRFCQHDPSPMSATFLTVVHFPVRLSCLPFLQQPQCTPGVAYFSATFLPAVRYPCDALTLSAAAVPIQPAFAVPPASVSALLPVRFF